MRKITMKLASVLASIALLITVTNVNQTCMFIMNQPNLPESASKLRKI